MHSYAFHSTPTSEYCGLPPRTKSSVQIENLIGLRNCSTYELSSRGVGREFLKSRSNGLLDLVRGGWARFTFDPTFDGYPIWSPDGTQIAFESTRKGPVDIYLKASSQSAQPLLESAEAKWPEDWSQDGRFLLYHVTQPKNGFDLMALPMTSDERKPIVIANAPFMQDAGQFSPDGQWVAYKTDESGTFEIMVQSFPSPTAKFQVVDSHHGGDSMARNYIS